MNRACPCGSGYSLQVLALLRAFRFYPSRGSIIQLGPLQMLRKFLLMRKRHKVKGKGHKVKGKGHKVKNKGHKVKGKGWLTLEDFPSENDSTPLCCL